MRREAKLVRAIVGAGVTFPLLRCARRWRQSITARITTSSTATVNTVTPMMSGGEASYGGLGRRLGVMAGAAAAEGDGDAETSTGVSLQMDVVVIENIKTLLTFASAVHVAAETVPKKVRKKAACEIARRPHSSRKHTHSAKRNQKEGPMLVPSETATIDGWRIAWM